FLKYTRILFQLSLMQNTTAKLVVEFFGFVFIKEIAEGGFRQESDEILAVLSTWSFVHPLPELLKSLNEQTVQSKNSKPSKVSFLNLINIRQEPPSDSILKDFHSLLPILFFRKIQLLPVINIVFGGNT